MPHETVARLLKSARLRLRDAGIETAHLDARLLLQQALGLSHEILIAEPDRTVLPSDKQVFDGFLARRLRHEPVSRILGEREFYGRSFALGPATLDPRPATETLIDAARAHLHGAARLLDLGTGTGAIAITLLAEFPLATGTATDVSPQAIEIAKKNAKRHDVADRLELRMSDWFSAVPESFDLILSNPPYIPSVDIPGLAPDVKFFDPLTALDGGADGLDAYRQIAAGTRSHLRGKGLVMVEIGAGQAEDITGIFAAVGLAPNGRWSDLDGHVRCLAFSALC